MSIINSQPLIGASGQGGGYNLTNSLRFRSSASAWLNRTPSTTTNRQIWTWSAWVKQGSALNSIFSTNASDNNSYNYFGFDSNAFRLYQWNGGSYDFQFITTPVYRDPAAWYHFVIQVDTTQATAANRVRLYVNGIQVTAFSTNTTPSQNLNTYVNNSSYSHLLARNPAGSSTYFDGYLDEINFIDGQALTPTSFGSFNALTGVWQPARYTGTYGTNGFYLPFTDNSALTTSSNVGLGRDFSGNGNYWTTNNISITAGVTYDSMTDVPTLTSATTANYAVGNQLDKNSSGTLADGNLKWTAGASQVCVRGSFAIPTSGKYYMECLVGTASSGVNGISFGLATSTVPLTTDSSASGLYQIYAAVNRQINLNGTQTGTLSGGFSANDILQIAVDVDNQKMWLGVNNTWYNSAYTANGDPVAGTNATSTTSMVGLFPFSNCYQNSAYWNFGQRPFSYTPPTGFVALNTFNLPSSTIVAGNKQMDATTYTGTGATQTIVNAGGMQPDMVWTKARSAAIAGLIYDSVRGATKYLQTNSTAAEGTGSDSLTAFASNGFTVGADTSTTGVNQNGTTYVGWQWKAGGTAVTNTAGSITSTVSANPTAGFSVVTYTGNGTSGATVGHGLGVAPSMVIVKRRSAASNWSVSATALGATKILFLEQTAAAATDPGPFASTLPSSTVITLGSSTDTNASSGTFVAYCWSQIAGYSAFGSYTGNGSADGPFVYLGFRPRFIMIKQTTSASDWVIFDTSRDPSNMEINYLVPNSSSAEASGASVQLDGVSNGIKIRGTWAGMNSNSQTYIYMAFAENPFKNSLAR